MNVDDPEGRCSTKIFPLGSVSRFPLAGRSKRVSAQREALRVGGPHGEPPTRNPSLQPPGC